MSGNFPLFDKSSNFGVEGYDSGLKCSLKRRICLGKGISPPHANAIHTFIYKKGRVYALPSCTASGVISRQAVPGHFPMLMNGSAPPPHVPSTPPYWLASDDHFLKRMPTDPLILFRTGAFSVVRILRIGWHELTNTIIA